MSLMQMGKSKNFQITPGHSGQPISPVQRAPREAATPTRVSNFLLYLKLSAVVLRALFNLSSVFFVL